MSHKKTIYLDYAATTPLDPAVLKVINDTAKRYYANASSLHYPGQQSKVALEKARRIIAESIKSLAGEIIFTSGGTESNNLALIGTARANRSKGNHVITTTVEHPSVLECCRYLEHEGFRLTYLKVDRQGQISLDELRSCLTGDTILVSVMMANNETGCIMPIQGIGQILRERNIAFHTDAVQSYGKIDFSVKDLEVDIVTLSAHKIYGPEGIGALYVRTGTAVDKILFGGAQETNRRPGTESIGAISGFAAAVRLMQRCTTERGRIKKLRDYFESELKHRLPYIQINGDEGPRLFSHSNIYFPFMAADSLAVNLDQQGVAVSVGSACSSGVQRPSHVLTAMGLEKQRVNGSVRFSLGRFTTRKEIEKTITVLFELYRNRQKVPRHV